MFDPINPDPASTTAAPSEGVHEETPCPPEVSAIPGPALEDTDSDFDEEIAEPIPPDWREDLRREMETWLASIDEIPLDDDLEDIEPPDLYSFYEELAILSAENRKGNRRTAEALSQWGETLAAFEGELQRLRDQLSRQPASPSAADTLPRSYALALIEVMDRILRLTSAAATPPSSSWWGNDSAWRKVWEKQRQALDILRGHVDALLKQAGVVRFEVRGRRFDPTMMAAVDTVISSEQPHHTVAEEIAPGYRFQEELLRTAQVKVTLNPSHL